MQQPVASPRGDPTRMVGRRPGRRRLLGLLAAGAGALPLSSCDVWNLVGQPSARSPGGSPLSIPALRARRFPPSEIRLHKVAARDDDHTSYVMSYASDDLHVTGMATIPIGQGPFPVVLLNHGYVLPSQYATGVGTRVMAHALARRGYVTLATDYRGLGGSQDDSRINIGARLEFVIDVLNLASAAREFPEAQPGRVGMWGHSLGGELAIRAGVVDPWIGPIALWAPLSVWIDDISDYYRVPTSSSSDQLRANLSAGNYLEGLAGPVDIHQARMISRSTPRGRQSSGWPWRRPAWPATSTSTRASAISSTPVPRPSSATAPNSCGEIFQPLARIRVTCLPCSRPRGEHL